MKKIAIIGKFHTAQGIVDGQAVKTTILFEELERIFGRDKLTQINTYGWKKRPARLFAICISAVWNCDHVIFMTDAGGIKVFPWLLRGANVLGKCKLHYAVVGGWLVSYLRNHRFLSNCLKRFYGIYVETSVMENGLKQLGFSNVHLMPNCKTLTPLTEDQLVYCADVPYRFCTFSRVMEEKGIADAVKAIQAVNEHYGRTVCTLDIFGQVDPDQTVWFEQLSAEFTDAICYGGVVPYDKSVEVVSRYCALLFPTKFYTEGIPGTIIDAYAAGVPVISAQWESFSDIVDHGTTGIGYPFGENERLKDILIELVENPGRLNEMKKHCLKKAVCYLPENVMNILLEKLM